MTDLVDTTVIRLAAHRSPELIRWAIDAAQACPGPVEVFFYRPGFVVDERDAGDSPEERDFLAAAEERADRGEVAVPRRRDPGGIIPTATIGLAARE